MCTPYETAPIMKRLSNRTSISPNSGSMATTVTLRLTVLEWRLKIKVESSELMNCALMNCACVEDVSRDKFLQKEKVS